MKKIFILTGEPSGDKLASKVISQIQKNDPNIEYSCVGGTHLNSLGIKSIFDLKEITYIGFTSVLLNILKIRKKINYTVEEIIKFDPDIFNSLERPLLKNPSCSPTTAWKAAISTGGPPAAMWSRKKAPWTPCSTQTVKARARCVWSNSLSTDVSQTPRASTSRWKPSATCVLPRPTGRSLPILPNRPST